MNAHEYILSKQIQWAHNNDIKLVGSEKARGRPAYTQNLNENLFEPLNPDVEKQIGEGDGGETKPKKGVLPKMRAVHSSSALGVNIFQYWMNINQIPKIAAACGLCSKNNNTPQKMTFEEKFQISKKFIFSPNIDVTIENSEESKYKLFAIECKFSEAYTSRGHSGIDPKYLDIKDIWKGIPRLHKLAKKISPDDNRFKYLHEAQLIKHILGLKKYILDLEKKDKVKKSFRLLYLWYDCIGHEGSKHRKEIESFTKTAKSDKIKFHAMSYQELIIKLSKEYRDTHKEYFKYITSRYL